jgi:hypothetical protein
MKQPFLCTIIAALASLLFIASEVLAQGDAPRFEIGGQFSLLPLNKPSSQFEDFEGFVSGQVTEPGFGARFTYNATNNIALEAEGNFFPGRYKDFDVPSGQIYQGQFGVKAGKRFKKVGLFIKIRPGFVRFTKVSQFTGLRAVTFIHPFYGEVHYENAEFRIGKATYLSTDVGGVVEFYPSRRIVTRLDVGDTIIRYGIYREPLGVVCPLSAPACPTQVFERPAETMHNLQFSAGIGIRF